MRRIFFSPGEPRLRAGWRILGQLSLLLVFLNFFGVLLQLVMPISAQSTNEQLTLFGTLVSLLAITTSVFLARRLLDRRSITSLGIQINARAFGDVLAGILISGVILGTVVFSERVAGWLTIESFAWQTVSLARLASQMLFYLFFFILVGWQEELLSRGYWLQNMSDGLNLTWGIILSSAAFALAHLVNPGISAIAIGGLFLSGLLFAYGYLATRHLWLPIGLHIGWNIFEGPVFGYPVSGVTTFNLIQQSVRGPELYTGGAFGPEAGLVILPSLILGAALVYLYAWWTKQRNDNHHPNSPSQKP